MKEFQEKLAKCSSAEEKIGLCLEFMRKSLSQEPTPHFREFWEVKKTCLPFFKEGLLPKVRSELWGEYIELSNQVRYLKEISDEQSAFAVEQIDLAIAALEKDLEHSEQFLSLAPSLSIPDTCLTLKKKEEEYHLLQRELYLLNTLAARVHSLRKEVMKTDMRIRHKNQFFERLSKIGDSVFPKRKELIQQVSAGFMEDVQQFSKENFNKNGDKKNSPFILREEIKALQQLAKELTLDSPTFTQTRLELSRLWELLREEEKERRKEGAEKREIFKKNSDLVMDKIKPFAERCAKENFTMEEAAKQSLEIQSLMKELELGREEVRLLKEELQKAKKPVLDRAQAEERAREKMIEEAHRQKREKIQQVQKQVEEILLKVPTETVEFLVSEKERLTKEVEGLSLTSAEKDLFHQALKKVRDAILEKKEKSLSTADLRSLEELKRVLEERKVQRHEIKTHLETYRHVLSGSGFDFEKAMRYQQLLDEEKGRLNKVNEAIEAIEDKIIDLET